MSVLWFVFCPVHRESLELGRWWYLSHIGSFDKDDLERVRTDLARDRRVRPPVIWARDERILDFVDAFLERHAGCTVRSGTDADDESMDSKWLQRFFRVEEDAVFRRLEWVVPAETLRDYIREWAPLVEQERAKLKGRVWWGRKKHEAWVCDMERQLADAQAGTGTPQPEFAEPSPGDDLLEALRTEPFITGS